MTMLDVAADFVVGQDFAMPVVAVQGHVPDSAGSAPDDLRHLTVSQLAAKLEEMTRLVISLGAQIQSRAGADQDEEPQPDGSGEESDVSPEELKRLARMLSHFEAARAV